MTYLAIAVILLYYCVFLVYYQRIIPSAKGRLLPRALTLAAVVAAYLVLGAHDLRSLSIPVIMAALIVGLRFSTGMNGLQAFYGGSLCVLSAYCFRGMFVAISSFVFWERDFLSDTEAYYAITLVALPLALVFFLILRRTLLPDHKLRRFLADHNQLKVVVAYEIVATVNLTVINEGRYLSLHSTWYMETVLGASVLTVGMLIYAVHQSIYNTELLEYQWTTKMLERQYHRQLLHYKSYQKYTESLREFRHDYKAMTTSLKTLLRAGDSHSALRLLDGMYEDMRKKVQIHKQYSDHVVLDSMLQDLANVCTEHGIRLSSHVFAPRDTGISLLDAIRVFSNLADNAVEACLKVPPADRFIEVSSEHGEQWVMLQMVNAYGGEGASEEGSRLNGSGQGHQGLGLGIVNAVVENLGGFLVYEADAIGKVFQIRLHIPRLPVSNEPPPVERHS